MKRHRKIWRLLGKLVAIIALSSCGVVVATVPVTIDERRAVPPTSPRLTPTPRQPTAGADRRMEPTQPATPTMTTQPVSATVTVTATRGLHTLPMATSVPPTATVSATTTATTTARLTYDRFQLPAGTLPHPHGLVVLGTTAFTIDKGALQTIGLEPNVGLRPSRSSHATQARPTKDLIDVAVAPNGTDIWAIDRMGDLLEYHPSAGTWQIKRTIEDRYSEPSQLYLALATYNQRAYILDESQGQIWRFPADALPEGYIPGKDVWKRLENGYDLTRAVDVAVDGDLYLLIREEPDKKRPAKIVRMSGLPPTTVWTETAGADWNRPLAIWTAPHAPLYLIADDGHALLELDKRTGKVLQRLVLPNKEAIRAVTVAQDRLYVLAPDTIYAFPGHGQTISLPSAAPPDRDRPDNAARWANLKLKLPVPARYLSDRDSLLPGAPRLYRFGVHEGLDFFGIATGSPISRATSVSAAAAGRVIRVDDDYHELSLTRFNVLLKDAEAQRNTPDATEDLLRGRQVWIDHGDGLVTRYAHLSAVSETLDVGQWVAAGTIIGRVGNSGAEGGIRGSDAGLHLHFEIRLDDTYLGRWLTPLETRRLFDHLFGFD